MILLSTSVMANLCSKWYFCLIILKVSLDFSNFTQKLWVICCWSCDWYCLRLFSVVSLTRTELTIQTFHTLHTEWVGQDIFTLVPLTFGVGVVLFQISSFWSENNLYFCHFVYNFFVILLMYALWRNWCRALESNAKNYILGIHRLNKGTKWYTVCWLFTSR